MDRRRNALFALTALVCIAFSAGCSGSGDSQMAAQPADPDASVDALPTASPIKHVIIIVGENRSFDHLFATYIPKHVE